MGLYTNLLSLIPALSLRQIRVRRKEIAMNGPEFFILYFAVRIIIPFGMLLLIGELLRQKEAHYWLKRG